MRLIVPILVAAASPAMAVDVAVVGLFPNKAVVQINGGATRTLSIGQKTSEGVTLIGVERGAAILEFDGRRRTLKLGQQHAARSSSVSPTVSLAADSRGHFVTEGQINGQPVVFVVDTGASFVSLSAADARRLGIPYRGGKPAFLETANGVIQAYRVILDNVRVGDISVDNVEGVVAENRALPVLLGMSFLNRMNMRREGQILTLTKRY